MLVKSYSSLISSPLIAGSFSCGYNPDGSVFFPITMTNHQQPGIAAYPQKNKPVFLMRMIRVIVFESMIIIKNSLSFLKRNAMLTLVT